VSTTARRRLFSSTARRYGAQPDQVAAGLRSPGDRLTKEEEMGFLDKAKATAEQAASKAKEGVEDVQTKRELTQSYGELGKVAYALAARGEITHAELTPMVEKIRELEARVQDESSPESPPVAGPQV